MRITPATSRKFLEREIRKRQVRKEKKEKNQLNNLRLKESLKNKILNKILK